MSKKLLALITSLMTLVVLCGAPAVAFASGNNVIKKEETVYVVTDSNGAQNDVIVSDHLYNEKQVKSISDETTLSDIENVKGDETFKQNGDKLEWAAKGNDIYYQGKTDAEVPVEMSVTYTLDGQSITGPELQGKSGDVSINISYTNNGKYEGKTVPFIVLTGLIVNDTSFTNIKVDHGKIVDDGDKQVVVGMAAPGLAQSLDVAEADLGFGDSVKITGNAKKFNVEDMITIATNSVFEDVNTGDLGDLDFDDEINQLNNGAKKLVNGSDQLYKGLNKMAEQSPKLKEGTTKLKVGAAKLKAGSDKTKASSIAIKDGIGTLGSKLNESMTAMVSNLTNIKQLATGITDSLSSVKSNVANLNILSGSVTTDATTAAEKAKTAHDKAENASTKLENASESCYSAKSRLEDAKTAVNSSGLNETEKKEIISIINSAGDQVDIAKSDIDGESSSAMLDLASVKTNASEAETASTNAGKKEQSITSGLKAIGDSIGAADAPNTLIYSENLIALISQGIIDNIKESTTTGDLAKGLKQLNDGAGSLVNGENLVNGGATQLADGTAELDSKADALADGADQLSDGSKQLSDGMQKLYKDGIKKIVDLYNDDLKGLTEGLDNVMDAGKGYKTFTKLPKAMDGNVKFIYKTTINK